MGIKHALTEEGNLKQNTPRNEQLGAEAPGGAPTGGPGSALLGAVAMATRAGPPLRQGQGRHARGAPEPEPPPLSGSVSVSRRAWAALKEPVAARNSVRRAGTPNCAAEPGLSLEPAALGRTGACRGPGRSTVWGPSIHHPSPLAGGHPPPRQGCTVDLHPPARILKRWTLANGVSSCSGRGPSKH